MVKKILQKINSDEISTLPPRVEKLLEFHNNSKPGVGLERAIHFAQFFKKNAGKTKNNAQLLAGALFHHLQNRSIHIYKDESIVGTHTEHKIGAICHIELAGFVMLEDLFRFTKRKTNPLFVDKKMLWKTIAIAVPYFFTKYLVTRAFHGWERIKYMAEQLKAVQFIINEAGGIAHFLPDYQKLIFKGIPGLRAEIQAGKSSNPQKEKKEYLESMELSLDAVTMFANRYINLAEKEGRIDLAESISKSIGEAPSDLQSALQLIWFFQMIIQIESLDQGISFGRLDQYLYPLYQKEIKSGKSREEIFSLFSAFFIKTSEVIPLFSKRLTDYFSGLPSGQAITLGGLKEDGKCAANDLTYLLLDVMDNLPVRQPNWHVRISKDSSQKFINRVMHSLSLGHGSPAIYNDEIIQEALLKENYPKKSIWNYATVGCVEPAVPGISFTSSDAALFNVAYPVEILFSTKRKLFREKNNKNLQPLTVISNMNELYNSLEIILDDRLDYLQYCLEKIERANAEFHPTPFSSLLVGGCIENGMDSTAGGAKFNASGIQSVGFSDLVDSLYIIDELVFKTKSIPLMELAEAVRTNFTNNEKLFNRIQRIKKFGNDLEATHVHAKKAGEMISRLIRKRINTRGGHWMAGMYSMTCHKGFGKHLGALPSGRKKGDSLANGAAPTDGQDALGPTASLNSSASFAHTLFANGINLNLKLDASIIQSSNGKKILESLVKGYFKKGGMQLQINVLDTGILLDAMKHPEKHKNLLVRVSGYSAYFADLTPDMQKELVERMLHGKT